MAWKFLLKVLVIIVLVCFAEMGVFAQSKTDSLLQRLKVEKTDEGKFEVYAQLTQEWLKTDLLKAMEYAQKTVDVAESIGDEAKRGKAISNLGNAYLHYGKYDKALSCFLEASEIAHNLKDTNKVVKLINNIGALYQLTGDLKQALASYKKALQLLQSIPNVDSDKELYANFYNNVGNIYNTVQNYDSAAWYYKKAISVSVNTPYIQILAICYNNLALNNLKTNKLDSVIYFLNQSIDLHKQSNNRRGLIAALEIKSEYYKKVNNTDSSLFYTLQANHIANEIHDLLAVSNTSQTLCKLYENLNQTDSALKYLHLYTIYKDSVYNENSHSEFSRIELEYKLAKQEDELKSAQLKKEFFYIILLITLCAIVIIVTLLYFFLRNKHIQATLQKTNIELKHNNLLLEKENLQHDLILKNKELTTNVLNLLQKNEIIKKITEKLMEVKNNMLPENKAVVQNVITELQQSTNDDLWDEFELRFQHVHNEFYTKLNNLFPDLTTNESKLCAFLRLKMTTKEIAAITKQTQHSIEVARSRLRKKLNLTNTDINLITFLEQL